MSTEPASARPASAGSQSRQAILAAAAQLATVEGLEGLSIGRLADAVGMSKSGLYAHFRSKVELQLATIETAGGVFQREVIEPALAVPPGTGRIVALGDEFLSHVERGVFPGGCFFAVTAAEMSMRPGPVRDSIGAYVGAWLRIIEDAVRDARALGEIGPGVDAPQLAFETNAMLVAANLAYPLFGDRQVLERARIGVRERLRAARA